jgi:tetratricopeptide (TPR) repeat protein
MRARPFICFIILGFCLHLHAGVSTPESRAAEVYQAARALFQSQPTNAVAAWQLAAACFDECEFSHDDAERARFAQEGIRAAREAVVLNPVLAAAHYYLGMDLAQLARTKLLGALNLLDEVEKEWKRTAQLDENFDYAGADRNLGMLYVEAPGWPLSMGSTTNARQHLLRAVKLHPEYPENHLNLIEAYLKWNNRAEGKLAAKEFAGLLPAATKKFTGPAWESYWVDWNKRWSNFQAKLSKWGGGVGVQDK